MYTKTNMVTINYEGENVGAKDNMAAERYRKEQDDIRGSGIGACVGRSLAIETNTGKGNLTRLYKTHFQKVITNDINPLSVAEHNMDSLDFIRDVVNNLPDKIDLIDIDSYRCPVPEVKELFLRLKNDCPVVLCISDGLGLWMKRSSDVQKIVDRYLLDDFVGFDRRHPWRQHIQFWEHLLKKLTQEHGLRFETIKAIQTPGKNYVLASYLITK